MSQNRDILLEVRHLAKHFTTREGAFGRSIVRAVDDVSFNIRRGASLGLVGESGSGKTTVGRTVMGLHRRTAGEVLFNGIDIHTLKAEQLRSLRPHFQLVFQDPMGSLNPRVRVGDAIGEALLEHKLARADNVRDKVLEVMQICGLAPEHYARYPHEFSGGQRQRIGIARAISLKPELIVADEPVSALDVSIQAQIINLFSDLKEHQGVTFLFISHDLAVVEHLCDDIAVMYLGKIVEMASKEQLFRQPRHPYTQGLLSAIPIADPDQRRERCVLKGEQPNPAKPPTGCHFHPRCALMSEKCSRVQPELKTFPDGHQVRCHFA